MVCYNNQVKPAPVFFKKTFAKSQHLNLSALELVRIFTIFGSFTFHLIQFTQIDQNRLTSRKKKIYA